VVLGLLAALGACDDAPTAADDAAPLEESVLQEWSNLPTLADLEDPVRDEASARGLVGANAWLAEADLVRVLSVTAEGDGDAALALAMDEQGALAAAQAVVAVEGAALALEVTGQVEAALARLEGEALRHRVRAEARRSLDRAADALARARVHLGWGEAAAALVAATDASGHLRDLAPDERARLAIAKAEIWLARAEEASAGQTSDDIAAALERARVHLRAAVEAYETGAFREAVRHAHRSLALSRWVLRQLSDRPGDGSHDARVGALIGLASAWLARAVEDAGTNPPAAVAEALREATELLEQAERAFEAGELRDAAQAALGSIRISQRLVAGSDGTG
jgi:HEPN domain-containing protein